MAEAFNTATLPPAIAHQLLRVKPGDRLVDGYEKVYKFLAERQPVDHPYIYLQSMGLAGLTVSSTLPPQPARPFSAGFYTKQSNIKAHISAGRVNGNLLVPDSLMTVIRENKITAGLKCKATYEGRGVFEAAGQAAQGMALLLFLIVRARITELGAEIYETDFKIQQLPRPPIPQNECWIPLAGQDEEGRSLVCLQSHVKVETARSGQNIVFWYCAL